MFSSVKRSSTMMYVTLRDIFYTDKQLLNRSFAIKRNNSGSKKYESKVGNSVVSECRENQRPDSKLTDRWFIILKAHGTASTYCCC